jgi:hypothetical protein
LSLAEGVAADQNVIKLKDASLLKVGDFVTLKNSGG